MLVIFYCETTRLSFMRHDHSQKMRRSSPMRWGSMRCPEHRLTASRNLSHHPGGLVVSVDGQAHRGEGWADTMRRWKTKQCYGRKLRENGWLPSMNGKTADLQCLQNQQEK